MFYRFSGSLENTKYENTQHNLRDGKKRFALRFVWWTFCNSQSWMEINLKQPSEGEFGEWKRWGNEKFSFEIPSTYRDYSLGLFEGVQKEKKILQTFFFPFTNLNTIKFRTGSRSTTMKMMIRESKSRRLWTISKSKQAAKMKGDRTNFSRRIQHHVVEFAWNLYL